MAVKTRERETIKHFQPYPYMYDVTWINSMYSVASTWLHYLYVVLLHWPNMNSPFFAKANIRYSHTMFSVPLHCITNGKAWSPTCGNERLQQLTPPYIGRYHIILLMTQAARCSFHVEECDWEWNTCHTRPSPTPFAHYTTSPPAPRNMSVRCIYLPHPTAVLQDTLSQACLTRFTTAFL